MNVGEKISLYKEKLGFKTFNEFGRAAGISGSWIGDISKKEEIKQVNDMNNVIKLCKYLGITIDQLVINDDSNIKNFESVGLTNINSNCEDIGIIINEMISLLNKPNIKMDGSLLNDKSKQMCKNALDVVKTLIRQQL